MSLWVEKYRPVTRDEIIGLPAGLRALKLDESMPHLLFVGGAGIGKTTTARAIMKEMNADGIELNASDERGIDTIREKIKFFCMKASLQMKVILLDEADQLTKDSQQALRRILEEYAEDTRFILTGNYERGIIDPLVSRCVRFEFATPPKDEVVKRMAFICDKEAVQYTLEDLLSIVEKGWPDIRQTIMLLYKSSRTGKVCPKEVETSSDILTLIYVCIQDKKFEILRKAVSKYQPNYLEVYTYLFNQYFSTMAHSPIRSRILIAISDAARDHQLVADPEVNLMALVFRIAELTENY